MNKYRKKPLIIEAIQYNGDNVIEIIDFMGREAVSTFMKDSNFVIVKLEGNMTANVDDYIIKGVKGEFYPCKPDIFEASYEKVEND